MPVQANNPYQFVPFPKEVPRAPIPVQTGHGRTGAQGFFSGELKCTMFQETKTPILVVTRGAQCKVAPMALPATSLRGMARSTAEMIGQGCGSHIGEGEERVFNESRRERGNGSSTALRVRNSLDRTFRFHAINSGRI